jgi:glycosyltransferase involved in cell wall biosynthesis
LGGIELHVRDLAWHQRLAGHEVTIATRTPAATVSPVCEDVLRVRALTSPDLATLAPDVVHAHLSVVSPMATGVARRAARLGLPTVVTVHSLWADLAVAAPLARAAIGLDSLPITWTAVSEPAAREVHRVVGRPVEVLPNAVDLAFWRSVAGSSPRGPRTTTGPTVLSVMRLTTVKRTIPLARILHAVAAHTNMNAVVVGDGPKRASLERYVQRHGLSERVRMTGALSRDQVREEMAAASVFLAPASRESFGIAALEARTAGLPVIAHARSGVATFVRPRIEGLLGANDEELAHHTTDMLRDESLRDQIARHNRAVPPRQTWPLALSNNFHAYALAGASTPGRYGDDPDLEVAIGQ